MRLQTLRSFLLVIFSLCITAASLLAADKVIIGSTKAEVDTLMAGWSSRRSNRATESRPIYYYTKDVEAIVTFSGGKAVGVAVIDRPGVGVSPIPDRRYKELLVLIGGGEPKASDLKRDSSGVREFSVGDAD